MSTQFRSVILSIKSWHWKVGKGCGKRLGLPFLIKGLVQHEARLSWDESIL